MPTSTPIKTTYFDPIKGMPQVKPAVICDTAVEIDRFLRSVQDTETLAYRKGFIEGCYWSKHITQDEYRWLKHRQGINE